MIRFAAAALPLLCLAACDPAGDAPPAPSPAANVPAQPTLTGAPAPAAADAVADRLKAWVKREYADMELLMLKSGRADLDGDGRNEVLAYVGGPMVCGTGGCNLVVLKDDGKAFAKVGNISVSQMPVGVLESRTNGWRDLAVTTYGGGAKERIMKVPFDGRKYAQNPTVAPASEVETIGTEVIAEGELERLD